MQIGTLIPSKDGSWIGSIQTLSLDRKIRIVPNDARTSDKAPTHRILSGLARIGDAWEAKTNSVTPKTYYRLQINDPGLPEQLTITLFPSDDGQKATLVWNRWRNA